jgi:carbon monoxide dehydrogenase subunit G
VKLTSQFVVGVPLERTWSVLLDVPREASALSGATIDPEPADGAFRGTMKVTFGASPPSTPAPR